jgi:hypothetical protein
MLFRISAFCYGHYRQNLPYSRIGLANGETVLHEYATLRYESCEDEPEWWSQGVLPSSAVVRLNVVLIG